ncbi:MAG TPA: hypothetical protein VE127_08285, partial [Solirubrobacteraceae bacterium]|nr:hypothetical protein [Solirubrobacteraceae bacterium]
MTDPWRSAKITHFEHVPAAAAAVALLRIEAKGSWWRSGDPTAPPVLLADDGERVGRFAPLPASPDDRGMLRIAYSVPAETIAPQTVFSLRLADGSVLSLPRPTAGTPRVDETRPAAAPGPPAPAPAAEELRQENERLRATVDELEVWRGELERRLAATTTELGAAATRLRENEQELGRLREALAEAQSEGAGAATGPGHDAELAALLRAADRVADAARELTDARTRVSDAGPADTGPADTGPAD